MYEICNVDYYEWDAFLVIHGVEKRLYFQFNGSGGYTPTLADAIRFFKNDSFQESKDALALVKEAGLCD